MQKHEKGHRVGILGLALFLASWIAIYLAARVMPYGWEPHIWFIVMTFGLPSALIAGIIAGRMSSRWWYCVSTISFLAEGMLIAALAV